MQFGIDLQKLRSVSSLDECTQQFYLMPWHIHFNNDQMRLSGSHFDNSIKTLRGFASENTKFSIEELKKAANAFYKSLFISEDTNRPTSIFDWALDMYYDEKNYLSDCTAYNNFKETNKFAIDHTFDVWVDNHLKNK